MIRRTASVLAYLFSFACGFLTVFFFTHGHQVKYLAGAAGFLLLSAFTTWLATRSAEEPAVQTEEPSAETA